VVLCKVFSLNEITIALEVINNLVFKNVTIFSYKNKKTIRGRLEF